MTKEFVIKVKGSSNVHSVAGSISKALMDGKQVIVQSIGAGATNQAVKSIAIGRSYVSKHGRDFVVRPGFGRDGVGEEEITIIKQILYLV